MILPQQQALQDAAGLWLGPDPQTRPLPELSALEPPAVGEATEQCLLRGAGPAQLR